jgi:tetratricopeptide (TPR) repeat protein
MEPEIWAYAIAPARAALARVSDPAGAPALVAEGRVLTLEMKYGDAVTRFDRAAAAAPEDPAPLVYKGEAQLYARQEGPARASFTEAKRRARLRVERRADDVEALYHLGVAQQRLGEHDAAFATLDRARSLAPSDERMLYQMGATRYLQQRWQDAVDLTTQALERNQRLAYGYWVRGNAAGQVDRKDLLVNDLRRFVELAPNAPEAERARRILSTIKG